MDYFTTLNAGGGRMKLYDDYQGDYPLIILWNQGAGTYSSDTRGLFDISRLTFPGATGQRPVGLYRVYCYVDGGTGYCRPPFTRYTGSKSYSGLPTPFDGLMSNESWFNRARSNDIYFNDCQPVQPAFSGMRRSGVPATCWDGWDYHFGTRIYYRVVIPSNWDTGGGDSLSIYYDYGGANQETVLTLTTAGTYEGFYDLTTTYTPGRRYRVTCRVDSGRLPDVQYLYVEPQVTDTGPGISAGDWLYMEMDDFTVNDWVLGLTYGEGTALELLKIRDRHIFSALCTSAKIGRRDYAVRTPSTLIDNVTYTGDLRLVHRYNTLIYRTTGGEMTWGTNTESLDDYGDDGYQVLDLTGLDLAYGQVYKVTAAAYAAEIP